MKIDNALKLFVETYDQEAMSSIDELSKDYGLRINGSTMKVFNMKESFDQFRTYLIGYGQYKETNINNSEASPHDAVKNAVNRFIEKKLFTEAAIPYKDIPEFIQEYVSGVQTLTECVNKVKASMLEAGVDNESIGDVNEFCDNFMDRLQESFSSFMDRALWASGYNSNKALFRSPESKKEAIPVFV